MLAKSQNLATIFFSQGVAIVCMGRNLFVTIQAQATIATQAVTSSAAAPPAVLARTYLIYD